MTSLKIYIIASLGISSPLQTIPKYINFYLNEFCIFFAKFAEEKLNTK